MTTTQFRKKKKIQDVYPSNVCNARTTREHAQENAPARDTILLRVPEN